MQRSALGRPAASARHVGRRRTERSPSQQRLPAFACAYLSLPAVVSERGPTPADEMTAIARAYGADVLTRTTIVAVAAVIGLMAGDAGRAQAPTLQLDGVLRGWLLQGPTAGNFSTREGVLRVEGPSGWLRVNTLFRGIQVAHARARRLRRRVDRAAGRAAGDARRQHRQFAGLCRHPGRERRPGVPQHRDPSAPVGGGAFWPCRL